MNSNKLICDYPFTHFEVNNPNGDVTFCCNHHLVLGNVTNNTILEIWNGEKYQEVRKKFLEGRIFEICSRECPVLQGWKDYEKLDWYKNLPVDSEVYKNAVLNEIEIEQEKLILDSKPRWIRFATSYRCNLKCYHCFQANDRKMQLRLPDKFFDELKNYLDTLQIIFFYGGEPFVENFNLELLEFISEQKVLIKVFIVTNGTLLNNRIAEILSKLNLVQFSISIDSINKELYEELRAPAKYDDILKNIKLISKLVNKENNRLNLTMTLNKKNMTELPKFIEFANELKALPFFQFAGNSFNNKNFRDAYEICNRNEYIELIKILENSLELATAYNLELTQKNIRMLISYSLSRIKELKLLPKTKKKIMRKFKIYKNIVKDFFSNRKI